MNDDIKYINNKGKILRSDKDHYIDQLDENSPLIFTRQLNNYLKNKYNLTIKEYYNIVIYGDKYYSPKCDNCGEDLEFISLSCGYRNKCKNCKFINSEGVTYQDGVCRSCGCEITDKNTSINSNICDKCSGKSYIEDNNNYLYIDDYKIYYPGKIAKVRDNIYLDQLDGHTKIRILSKFIEYINNKYGLSDKEYYNLVVFNDMNYNKVCECPVCNNYTKFLNINNGYKRFCSNSCGLGSRGDMSGNFKSYYERLDKTVIKVNNKRKKNFSVMSEEEIISLMYHGYRCYSGKYGKKYDTAFLYYAEFDYNPGIFKIGISVNVKDRWYKAKYKNPRILYEGSVEDVSKLEYTIKKTFVKNLVLTSEYPTETFSINDYEKIINFINNIIH